MKCMKLLVSTAPKFRSPRVLVWSMAVVLIGLTTQAQAQSGCSPAIAQRASEINREQLKSELERIEEVYKGHLQQPDWLRNSDGLLTACSNNNWPTPQVSNPFLQRLLSRAQERAVKMACNRARRAISDATGAYQNVLGSIPTYEDLMPDFEMPDLGSWPEIDDILPDGGGIDWPGIGGVLPPGTIPGIPGISQPPGTVPGIPGITPPVGNPPIEP